MVGPSSLVLPLLLLTSHVEALLKVRPTATHADDKESHRKNKNPFLVASNLYYEQESVQESPPPDTAYTRIYQIFHDNYIIRPPRDLWEGFLDAISNVNRGCWNGLCSVVDSSWDWYASMGVFGLLGGSAIGAVKGTMLAVGGIAAGVYQLIQGVTNTPRAISESNQGKTWEDGKWNYYSMNEEDKLLDQEIMLSPTDDQSKQSRQLRQRSRRKVKDMEYYNLLKVSADASTTEIKHAYYREALSTHPDKNVNDNKANEKFQQLSAAYHTLSNSDMRDLYDTQGKCSVLEQEDVTQIDSYTFFSIMFGSYLVEPYVGELKIASVVDSFLQLTDTRKLQQESMSATSNKTRTLKQRRRVLDIGLHLRDRLSKFVQGSQSEVELRASAKLEAVAIARGDFGDSFLISIGRSLMSEGKKFLGKHTSTLGLYGATATIQATSAEMVESYQTLVALLQSVTSSAVPVMEAFVADSKRQKEKSSSSSCQEDDKKAKMQTLVLMEKLEHSLPKVLRLIWQLNDRDIRQTLKDATEKLLYDKATQDVRLLRAKGLIILGREFYDMGMSTKKKDRWANADALKRAMAVAFEAAVKGDVGMY